MKITNIQMKIVDGYQRVLANFDITFDNCFVVHNVSLIKRDEDNSALVSFYSKKDSEGKFKNICHPITREFRQEVEETLINYYNEYLADQLDEDDE